MARTSSFQDCFEPRTWIEHCNEVGSAASPAERMSLPWGKRQISHVGTIGNDRVMQVAEKVPISTVQSSPATACRNTCSEEHPSGVMGKNAEETASGSASGKNRETLPEAKALPVSVRTTQCSPEMDTPTQRWGASAGTDT